MPNTIELTRLSAAQREATLRGLAREGLHPVTVGDAVSGPAGPWVVSDSPHAGGVLLDGRPVATIGAIVSVPADAHGCPACPHPGSGVIVSGVPQVLINGRPVAVAGSETAHRHCCTPGRGWLRTGAGASRGTTETLNTPAVLAVRRRLVQQG